MALDGPRLIYAREFERSSDEKNPADVLARALRLAREVEELLEDTSSLAPERVIDANGAHSTRIVRAMAASLVDELEAIVNGKSQRGIA